MGLSSQDGLTLETRGLWPKAEVLRLWGFTDWYISELKMPKPIGGKRSKIARFSFFQVRRKRRRLLVILISQKDILKIFHLGKG